MPRLAIALMSAESTSVLGCGKSFHDCNKSVFPLPIRRFAATSLALFCFESIPGYLERAVPLFASNMIVAVDVPCNVVWHVQWQLQAAGAGIGR